MKNKYYRLMGLNEEVLEESNKIFFREDDAEKVKNYINMSHGVNLYCVVEVEMTDVEIITNNYEVMPVGSSKKYEERFKYEFVSSN